MDIKNLISDYLKDIKLMQLATSQADQPWLCNVWYVIDDQDKVYWISRETRRHSQEIAQNPLVSCKFHRWFNEGLGQQGKSGVMAGKAQKLDNPSDIEEAYALYLARYPKLAEFQSLEASLDDTGDHKFYCMTPHEIIWWDEKNFPDQSRQKVL